MNIELGQIVHDTVTGFEGVAIKRLQELGASDEICIQPRVNDGKFVDPIWFVENRIKVGPVRQKEYGIPTFGADQSLKLPGLRSLSDD